MDVQINTDGPGQIEVDKLPAPAWAKQCSPFSSLGLPRPECSVTEGTEAYACSSCTIPVRINNFDRMRLQMFQLTDPTPIEVVACIKGDWLLFELPLARKPFQHIETIIMPKSCAS